LLAHLAARNPALRAAPVDLPDRHRTLRATVEWSTGRLAADDRVAAGRPGRLSPAGPGSTRSARFWPAPASPARASPPRSPRWPRGSLISVADRDGNGPGLDAGHDPRGGGEPAGRREPWTTPVRAAPRPPLSLALVRDPATFATGRHRTRQPAPPRSTGRCPVIPRCWTRRLARGLTAYLFLPRPVHRGPPGYWAASPTPALDEREPGPGPGTAPRSPRTSPATRPPPWRIRRTLPPRPSPPWGRRRRTVQPRWTVRRQRPRSPLGR